MSYEYLRLLTDERIATGQTEDDTNFTNAELQSIIDGASCSDDVFCAAAEVWQVKAGLLNSQMNNIASYTLGDESVKYTGLQAQYQHAIAMAEKYRQKAAASSVAYTRKTPDILYTGDDDNSE